jgi:hypothetical protein
LTKKGGKAKMKKKILFESICVSALLTLMVFSAVGTVFAEDWDDEDFDWGDYGSVVGSYVAGDYGGSSVFDYGYFGSGRDKGSANYMGYLWFWWTIDTYTNEWYDEGVLRYEEGALEAQYLAVTTLSWFYYGGYNWSLWAFAAVGYHP